MNQTDKAVTKETIEDEVTTTPQEPSERNADQMDEMFDIVDESNNPVGTASRQRCHDEGLLHRSTHVFLFRNKAAVGSMEPVLEVLLQQRSKNKKVGAELWDVSVAEHLSVSEDYLTATIRGLSEELNVNFNADSLVTVRQPYLSKQHYPEAGVLDFMFTSTFAAVYEDSIHGPIRFDETEVQAAEWWPVHMVMKEFKKEQPRFTRWLMIELRNINIVDLGKTLLGEF